MIFENGAKAIATCSRRLQLASLKLSIKYQCCGGSLQSSHQKNIRFDCKAGDIFLFLFKGHELNDSVSGQENVSIHSVKHLLGECTSVWLVLSREASYSFAFDLVAVI